MVASIFHSLWCYLFVSFFFFDVQACLIYFNHRSIFRFKHSFLRLHCHTILFNEFYIIIIFTVSASSNAISFMTIFNIKNALFPTRYSLSSTNSTRLLLFSSFKIKIASFSLYLLILFYRCTVDSHISLLI